MKIGILTYHHPENRNYGAMLQLYATYTTLKKLGHTPVVINYDFKSNKPETIKQKVISLVTYFLSTQNFHKFSEKHFINKTKLVNSTTAQTLNSELDIFLVGSDQVWRYAYVPNIQNFFLDFVDDVHKKISYAASFGINSWNEAPNSIHPTVQNLLKRFSHISVREKSGVDICKEFGVDAELVLDPVFLLEQSEYNKLLQGKEKQEENNNYIGYMLLDITEEDPIMLQTLANKLVLKLQNIRNQKINFIGKRTEKMYPIGKWLNFIKKSSLIVTDSYHCVAFCIIFRKQFICISNPERGETRLQSLLSLLELTDYFINRNSLETFDLSKKIDYNKVDKKLTTLKESSLNFLKKALVNNEN